jgi:hypothetical protein
MIHITIPQLKDFQTCERLYDYRHIQKLPETTGSRQLYSIKFENTLKSIVHYFFYKKQSGITPSYSSLLNRWEKLWFPKGSSTYEIIHEQHETAYGNMASLTTKAASVLLGLMENFSDQDIIPIAIDEEYICPITDDTAIKDKFDLIFYKNNSVYIVKWILNSKNKYEDTYVVDFTSMHVGFKNKFPDKMNIAKIGYYDLLNSKSNFNEFRVETADIEALKYWCESLRQESVFPHRRGLTSYCRSCPFDKPCSKWTFLTKKEERNA